VGGRQTRRPHQRFTLPLNEFHTPYRVINYHVCNGCWNDGAISFVHDDFEWCPRHKHTDRQYECTRFITADKVCSVIDRLMADHGFDPKGTSRKRKER